MASGECRSQEKGCDFEWKSFCVTCQENEYLLRTLTHLQYALCPYPSFLFVTFLSSALDLNTDNLRKKSKIHEKLGKELLGYDRTF